MARSIFKGPVTSKTKETDGECWFSAAYFNFTGGTWTFTRGAVGNYFMRKTAAAENVFAVMALDPLLKKIGADPIFADLYVAPIAGTPSDDAHDIRGVQLTTITPVYAIATDVLATHAALVRRITYANNVASVVATPSALTGALATATQASPYVTALTVATPYLLGNNAVQVGDFLEINVDTTGHATTVYDLIGVFIKFNYNLL